MINSTLLSIIVPVYNVEKYIKDCFNSIFDNIVSEDSVEIIFVNDGSRDDSFIILENLISNLSEFLSSKVILISQKNKGLSGARNTGFLKSTGKYIYFLDSDDYISNSFFKKVLPILVDEYDLVEFNSIKFFEKEGSRIENLFKNIISPGAHVIENEEDRSKRFAWQDWAVWYRVFNRKNLADNIFPEGYLYEDVLTVPFIYNNSKVIYSLDEYLIYYRFNPKSIMNTPNTASLLSTEYAVDKFNTESGGSYLNIVRSRFIIASVFNLLSNIGFNGTYYWLIKNNIYLSKAELMHVNSKKLKLGNKYPFFVLLYAFLKKKGWL